MLPALTAGLSALVRAVAPTLTRTVGQEVLEKGAAASKDLLEKGVTTTLKKGGEALLRTGLSDLLLKGGEQFLTKVAMKLMATLGEQAVETLLKKLKDGGIAALTGKDLTDFATAARDVKTNEI